MKPETLTRIRTEMHFTKKALGESLGLSARMIAYYETGHNDIPPYIALAVTCLYRRLPSIE
jgi:transcriptional regulator with XRE-family HTH domain